jgi:predicted methyltransferase
MNRALLLGPSLAFGFLAPPIVAFCVACADQTPAPQSAASPAALTPAAATVAASPAAAAPVSDGTASGAALFAGALAGSVRTDRERARDAARHPAETLAFFGVKESSTVVELWPGGGYYTAILAPTLAAKGKLAITHFDPAGDPKSENTEETHYILDRLAKTPDAFGKVERRQIATPNVTLGPDGSADFVLTFRNIHNWIEDGYADKVFAAAAKVLKSGGVLGVEEHRGRPGMTTKEIQKSGYVPEETVIQLAQAAGFKLADRSEVNANPKDTKDYPQGVWSLPPTFAEKAVNHDKYAAIGESDRMTLKFVKP